MQKLFGNNEILREKKDAKNYAILHLKSHSWKFSSVIQWFYVNWHECMFVFLKIMILNRLLTGPVLAQVEGQQSGESTMVSCWDPSWTLYQGWLVR